MKGSVIFMKKIKIYKCNVCGNLIFMLEDSSIVPFCCMKQMRPLEPNTSDGALEKHVPDVTREGRIATVRVGELDHPMDPSHYIQWIYLITSKGIYSKNLHPGDEPKADFLVSDDEVLEGAYAYCNIHGLWVREYIIP